MLFLSVIRNSQDIKIPQRTVLLMEELMGQMLTLMIILLSPGAQSNPSRSEGFALPRSPVPAPGSRCPHSLWGARPGERCISPSPGLIIAPKAPRKGINELFSAEVSTGEETLGSKLPCAVSRLWTPPARWLHATFLRLGKPQLNKTQLCPALHWFMFIS